MPHDHMVELPKAVWGIKIAQAIIAVLVLAFSAFEIAVIPNSTSGFAIFVALYSSISLIYYFVSLHSQHKLYNWIALLVLECLAVIFWLTVWALFAAALALAALYLSYYNDYSDYYSYKRDLVKRLDNGLYDAASALFYCTLALSLINWILYCVTLGFLAIGIHRHRKAGKPVQYGGASSAGSNTISEEEKNEMNPMPSGPQYQNYASNGPNPTPAPYEQQQQYSSGGYLASPVPANTHEVHGGPRY